MGSYVRQLHAFQDAFAWVAGGTPTAVSVITPVQITNAKLCDGFEAFVLTLLGSHQKAQKFSQSTFDFAFSAC